MAHLVEIKEILNGIQITETIDDDVVVKLISYQSKPFLRTTNETGEETYQIIDKVGEIYNIPALASEFRIIDANGNVFLPENGVDLIEDSFKLRLFRPDAEEDEFHIGTIQTTPDSVTINLPEDGINWAKISGNFYEKYYPDTFNFTPVTTGEKILIIYALPDAQVFHLAQGAESTEAVEPAYNGLFVARILVNSENAQVTENTTGFREKIIDGWNGVYINGDNVLINITNYGLRYRVFGSSNHRILGFINYTTNVLYDGLPLSIKNDTNGELVFANASAAYYSDPRYIGFTASDLPFSVKKGETASFAWRSSTNSFEIIKTGGGGADFPAGNAGDVLVKGAESWEASTRLTDVENEVSNIKIGGRNLIIKSESGSQLVLQEDGTTAVTDYSFVSNIIAVTEGEQLILSKPVAGTTRIAHYDASQDFITRVMGNGAKTELITIPAGVSFIKISPDSNGGSIENGFQLERGNKATDWQLAPEDVNAAIALKKDATLKKNLQNNNINYCGFAPIGSAENAAVWTVTKITVAAAGTITKETFTNITWSSVPF